MKLRHQAPKGYRINRFNHVAIKDEFAFCSSHNFVYNVDVEREKLYNAIPCYYTDKRFVDGRHNYSGEAGLFSHRFDAISLKACIRRTLNCKNIPVGTIVHFDKSWYFPRKKVKLSYLFKVKEFKPLDIEYEINLNEYSDNFTSCQFSKDLTDRLRSNGFIVAVYKQNTNFISSMISTAAAMTRSYIEPVNENGEIAVAYGFGKKIGFSSSNNSFQGYSNGCDNVLWDEYGYFNKWSQCRETPKTTNIDEIVELLKLKHNED